MNLLHRSIATGLLFASASLSYAQLEGSRRIARPLTIRFPLFRIPRLQPSAMLGWAGRRDARFGMFIHWGLYSIPAESGRGSGTTHIGEWIMNDLSIPVADYKALAKQFNPTGFSAHDIVALAKSAGMKYIVITSKHHDGFAMFDSRRIHSISSLLLPLSVIP